MLERRTPSRSWGRWSQIQPQGQVQVRSHVEDKPTTKPSRVWGRLQAKSELGITLENLSGVHCVHMVGTKDVIPGTKQVWPSRERES